MSKKKDDTKVKDGSGNVFADLGFPNASREQLKAKLMLEIHRAIKDRALTQVEAAAILGIQQPPCVRADEGAFRNLFSGPPARVPERSGTRRRDCRQTGSESRRRTYKRRGATVAGGGVRRNGSPTMSISKKRLKELEAIKDEDIDYSDIPEADEDFWKRAELRMPQPKKGI